MEGVCVTDRETGWVRGLEGRTEGKVEVKGEEWGQGGNKSWEKGALEPYPLQTSWREAGIWGRGEVTR